MFGDKIQDYEILEHLGKGGFAHVYRARCCNTGVYVAIKMIDKALMASAGMIGRVRQEVTIHSRLKHPAILELYTFFEDAHYVYLVLELAHNGELAKHFKLGTRGLSEKAAADFFKQVVSGVLYLHSHNIIHRDLSLNNLLLTKEMHVKIADFGLATQLNGPEEKHVTMCGTPNYISPEVASREVHGLPADVWGLGCMLYTLLVGRPPFHTQHVKTTLNRVINADYTIPPELSPPAQDLLQRLLCKDPSKRITLKGIMEHPFLNNHAVIPQKTDMSRDSGFLTTLHSTQHSTKLIKSECRGNLDFHASNNVYLKSHNDTPTGSFNVFQPGTENIYSVHSSGVYHKDYKMDKGNLQAIHMPLEKKCYPIDPQSVTDNLGNFNIHHRSDLKPKVIDYENKENIPKASNMNTNCIGVPPLCADRLPAISHRTRNAILKIEDGGVIVEFIKKKGKDREEKVVEVCKISKDGMKVIIYLTDSPKDKFGNLDHNPTPDEVFTYHNLPQKHWKKYLYAARFVDLVKAKTPKITLYSPLAKCQLMENGTDIEMFFYSGEKITSNTVDGLKVIDKSLKTHQNPNAIVEIKHLIDHFEECSGRMKRIQEALSCIPDECFPLIIGKRPLLHEKNCNASPSAGKLEFNTPQFNIGSFRAATSTQSDYNT